MSSKIDVYIILSFHTKKVRAAFLVKKTQRETRQDGQRSAQPLDDVEARLGGDQIGDLVDLERAGRLLEGFGHLALWEPAEIAGLVLEGRGALGALLCNLREILRRQHL